MAASQQSESATVIGTATYRERMALPPGAVFEAYLEDVSRADAPAVRIGAAKIESLGSPPFKFSIAYDPATIDETRTYSVRAQILVGSSPMFASAQAYAVLTKGNGHSVDILLRRVGHSGRASRATSGEPPLGSTTGTLQGEAFVTAIGLRLPATFRGDLPCADCPAIRYHLDLWPDQVFHLRQEYVSENVAISELGRWYADSERKAIVLRGGGEKSMQFEVMGADRLRLLGQDGRPIDSKLPYELSSDGTLSPAKLSLGLHGTMIYVADAARFTACFTGRSYPIAMERAFVELERAYRKAAREPGAPVLVTIEGSISPRPKMEGDGVEPTGGRSCRQHVAGPVL